MKKTTIFLTAVVTAISACGILSAADFETDINNVERQLAETKGAPDTDLLGLLPTPTGAKWWSVTFFGSAHIAAAKAALNFIDGDAFPDIKATKDILKDGSNDESGHPDPSKNGGDVKALWFGKDPFFKGGVIQNYEHFKFQEAYERLGTLIHLTQDQACPVHAANVKHGIGDSFEGSYGNDVKFSAARDKGDLEPYAYYQALQDETRRKLPGWTDPATGAPYWVTAPDAPPFGQDVTFGPWGHYGGRNNSDLYAVPPAQDSYSSGGNNNNNTRVSARPEIRIQQLAAAGVVTVSVLQSASRRLPPLVVDLAVAPASAAQIYQIKFGIYENRSLRVTYTASVYKDGKLMGLASVGEVALGKANPDDIMYSAQLVTNWAGAVKSGRLPPGNYIMEVRVTDTDGNTTPDEVNSDDITTNDTRAAFTII